MLYKRNTLWQPTCMLLPTIVTSYIFLIITFKASPERVTKLRLSSNNLLPPPPQIKKKALLIGLPTRWRCVIAGNLGQAL